MSLAPLALLGQLRRDLDAYGTAALANIAPALPPPTGLKLAVEVHSVRTAGAALVPPGATSLRLVVDLLGAVTLRSALVPPAL